MFITVVITVIGHNKTTILISFGITRFIKMFVNNINGMFSSCDLILEKSKVRKK